jgi:hypothetical protein
MNQSGEHDDEAVKRAHDDRAHDDGAIANGADPAGDFRANDLPSVGKSDDLAANAVAPISTQRRIKFFLTGIVFPAICFAAAHMGSATIDSPWQSGRLGDYVALLLEWPGHGPFLPLILISAAALGTWVIRPASSGWLVVQMGILTGAVLSAQFLIYVLLTSSYLTLIAGAILAAGLIMVVATLHWFASRARRFSIRHLLILTTVTAVLIALIQRVGGWPMVLFPFESATLLIMAGGPTLCVVTYVRASYWILAHAPKRPLRSYVAAGAGWAIAWGASWKLSVDIMFREYAQLPTTDPNCYVSTAAAHGHRRLVGGDGRGGLNPQTLRLKFLELALAAALPGFHRWLRRIYDRIGPPLARVCRHNIWIADASFLMLKPLEWTASILAKVTRFRPQSCNGRGCQ